MAKQRYNADLFEDRILVTADLAARYRCSSGLIDQWAVRGILPPCLSLYRTSTPKPRLWLLSDILEFERRHGKPRKHVRYRVGCPVAAIRHPRAQEPAPCPTETLNFSSES